MNELVEFLRARLAEREGVIARWDSDGKARVASMWHNGHPGSTTVASDHADDRWVARGSEVEDPRHVLVLWDPDVELTDAWAKLQLVEMHLLDRVTYPPRFDEFDPHSIVVCSGCGETRRSDRPGCRTLRLLALPWAGHADYQEVWKP